MAVLPLLPRRGRCAVLWARVVGILLLSGVAGVSRADNVELVEEIQANLARAVELRQQRANEMAAWRELKPELESMLALTRSDNSVLERQIEELGTTIADYEASLAKAGEDLGESRELLELMESRFRGLGEGFQAMVQSLPERLRGKGETIVQQTQVRLDGSDETALRRGIEVYLQFIEELMAYDRRVQAYSEIRALDDGRSGEVTVIRLGLGGGFYFSSELGIAGRIHRSGTEWKWEDDDALLPTLVQFKSVMDGDREASFIVVPLSLDAGGAR